MSKYPVYVVVEANQPADTGEDFEAMCAAAMDHAQTETTSFMVVEIKAIATSTATLVIL